MRGRAERADHRDIAPFLYGLTLTEEQRDDGHIRPIAQMLTRIHELDSRPITTARDVGHRLPSVCRHFSLMLCSILRYQGIPARPRCGFGAYFNPGRFEDHWVCEYWNVAQSRWILVDAQMDAIQRKTFKLDFNPVDVPRDRFIIAGDAWQMCRSGLADSAAFGLTHVHLQGLWFVQGNVLRDVASLNRMEMLPWDVWGAMDINDAALTFAGDEKFNEMRAIYESDDRLRAAAGVQRAAQRPGIDRDKLVNLRSPRRHSPSPSAGLPGSHSPRCRRLSPSRISTPPRAA